MKPILCPCCNRKFAKQETLLRHLNAAHRNKPGSAPIITTATLVDQQQQNSKNSTNSSVTESSQVKKTAVGITKSQPNESSSSSSSSSRSSNDINDTSNKMTVVTNATTSKVSLPSEAKLPISSSTKTEPKESSKLQEVMCKVKI